MKPRIFLNFFLTWGFYYFFNCLKENKDENVHYIRQREGEREKERVRDRDRKKKEI